MTPPPAIDPGLETAFWHSAEQLPGFPHGEPIRLRRMLFESDALARLPSILTESGARPDRPLIVLMDPTPMRRAGADLKPTVLNRLSEAGWSPVAVVAPVDATGQVHTDLAQIGRVQARLSSECAVLALGSGTVTDIAKHACFRREQDTGDATPFVVFQTANSVSAYTSNMAPVFVEGVKRTLPSRYPDALVCDLETLRDAPPSMTAAGVGDLLAASVSFADWHLAHRLGLDESYTPLAERLMAGLDSALPDVAAEARAGDLRATGALARWIALAGLGMSLSHATAPLSGYEHVLSHVLDMLGEAHRRPLAMHGAQVAIASRRMASIYQAFLRDFDPLTVDWPACFPGAEGARQQVEAAFADIDPTGRTGAECWKDYAVKLEAWHAHRDGARRSLESWPDLRRYLAQRVWPAAHVEKIMVAAGLATDFPGLQPPIEAAQAGRAFLTAHWIRKRFTLGDL
ncbi:MAG: sn-glycerol-1-phosphate dehydrogenase, partial [Chloroflexi bacterium]|nr:sn-glycerol-1-phosphate dehydrogenase [Chloroflexota bacterium]